MTPMQRLVLLAKSTRAAPIPPGTDKLSTKGIARWKSSSKEFRDDYLKAHPESAYKKIRVNTQSERISNDPDNREMKDATEDTLRAMGFKAKTPLKKTTDHLLMFLAQRGAARQASADKGTNAALKILDKAKPEDRQAVKDDAKAIIGEPRKKPSQILNRRGSGGLIAGLIGIGICTAMLGTGLVHPSVVAFIGIKALDFGIEKVRHTLNQTSIDEFLIAATIGNFINADSNGGFFENLKDSFQRSFGMKRDDDPENDDEEDDENIEDALEENDNDNKNQPTVTKTKTDTEEPKKLKRVSS